MSLAAAEQVRPIAGRAFRMNSFNFVDGVIEPDEELLGVAVALTANQLDDLQPGWYTRVTEEIQMESSSLCVLGQVFDRPFGTDHHLGGFSRGMEFFAQNDRVVQPFVFTHPKAAPLWRAEITRRTR